VFYKSIREAVDKNGQPFCALMAPYSASSMSDDQLKNIYAYLLSVPNDTPNKGTGCP
jgi:hypothetical protein